MPQIAHAKSTGDPILVYAVGVPGTVLNGVNKLAVPVYIQFIVTAPKPLKHLQFTLTGFNVRGLPVRVNDGQQQTLVLGVSGPFDPGKNYEVNTFHVEPRGFPGTDVTCVEIQRIKIRYWNGQTRLFSTHHLRKTLLPALRGHCGDQGPRVDSYDTD